MKRIIYHSIYHLLAIYLLINPGQLNAADILSSLQEAALEKDLKLSYINIEDSITESFDFKNLLPEKFDRDNIIKEKNHYVWGTNIIKTEDGKYHAIYSRWPRRLGFQAWVTHSEIAHAVSDHLTGPYKFKNLILPARGNDYWDGHCTHNPHLIKYNDKYYLYYMGNRGSGYWVNHAGNIKSHPDHEEWWINRNNQRIGVAVTEDLNGKWTRFDEPLIDTSENRLMTSTPTISIRPDGYFLMVFKYVEKNGEKNGGRVIHVTALAESPTGPFVETGIPFITHPTARFSIDDHVEWVYNGKYFCIAKDHDGTWSDYPDGSLLLYEGDENGMKWNLAENSLVIKAGEIQWKDGTSTLCKRTADMPKIYMEKGVMKALIFAVWPEDDETSFSLVIPLKMDE